MKKTLIILILIAGVFACDETPGGPDSPAPFAPDKRISQLTVEINYSGEFKPETREAYTYDGDDLKEITSYQYVEGAWKPYSIREMSYRGDEVEIMLSYYWELNGKDTLMKSAKDIRTISGKLLLEEHNFRRSGNDWKEIASMQFLYDGARIEGWTRESYLNDQLSEAIRAHYTYSSDQPVQILQEHKGQGGDWLRDIRYEFEYEEEELSAFTRSWYHSSRGWTSDWRREYHHREDKISRIVDFYWDAYVETWVLDSHSSFSYDAHGYLVEDIYNNKIRITYEYEGGLGNSLLLVYNASDILYNLRSRCKGTLSDL